MNEKAFQKYLATGEYALAEDAAPLTDMEKHDKRFHPEGYKEGDRCKFREALADGDIVDNVDQDKEDYSGGPKTYLFYLRRLSGKAPDKRFLESVVADSEVAIGEEIDNVDVEVLKRNGRDLVYQATVYVKKGALPPDEDRIMQKLNDSSGSYGKKFHVEFVAQVAVEPKKRAEVEKEEEDLKPGKPISRKRFDSILDWMQDNDIIDDVRTMTKKDYDWLWENCKSEIMAIYAMKDHPKKAAKFRWEEYPEELAGMPMYMDDDD